MASRARTIVETRMLVTADWGARLEGYCSDCTRTLSTGGISAQLKEIYEVCLAAQLAAVDGIKPGMTGVEADRISRAVIEEAGYGDNFGHGLGHGVGMLIHEAPRLSRESADTLEVGHVITIEPGIYLPGRRRRSDRGSRRGARGRRRAAHLVPERPDRSQLTAPDGPRSDRSSARDNPGDSPQMRTVPVWGQFPAIAPGRHGSEGQVRREPAARS